MIFRMILCLSFLFAGCGIEPQVEMTEEEKARLGLNPYYQYDTDDAMATGNFNGQGNAESSLTKIVASIDSLSKLPRNIRGKSVYILPSNGINVNSIEFGVFSEMLKRYLIRAGFEYARSQNNANYIVYLAYNTRGLKRTGTGSSHKDIAEVDKYLESMVLDMDMNGSKKIAAKKAPDVKEKAKGYIPPLSARNFSNMFALHERRVNLVFTDKTGRESFLLKLVSVGSCSNLGSVFPSLLKAIFNKFPGKTIETSRREVVISNVSCP